MVENSTLIFVAFAPDWRESKHTFVQVEIMGKKSTTCSAATASTQVDAHLLPIS
jgi:hypothetical protein